MTSPVNIINNSTSSNKARGIPVPVDSSNADLASDREEGILSEGEEEDAVEPGQSFLSDSVGAEFHQWCADLQEKVVQLQSQ